MNRIEKYVNDLFKDFSNSQRTRDLKEELLANLNERFEDALKMGLSEDEAYQKVIDSLGDVNEMRADLMAEEKTAVNNDSGFIRISQIVVKTISFSIRVTEEEVDRVYVKYDTPERESALRIRLEQVGDRLEFTQEKRRWSWREIGFMESYRVDFIVPRGQALKYTMETVNGGIRLDAPSRGESRFKSVNGSIESLQNGEQINVSVVNGTVRLYGSYEEIDCSSVNGSVRLIATQQTRHISCSTVNGTVRIALRNVSGYELKHAAIVGCVKDLYNGCTYPKVGHATYGDGSIKIKVSTTSGTIKLEDWND